LLVKIKILFFHQSVEGRVKAIFYLNKNNLMKEKRLQNPKKYLEIKMIFLLSAIEKSTYFFLNGTPTASSYFF
jgi:hypothetical protein